jgi:hypothetical protein
MVGSSKATKTMGIEKTQSFHRFQSLPFPHTTGIPFTPYFFSPTLSTFPCFAFAFK